ncbi:MAG: hypothetical protein GX550_00785 [Syntrophomonadaceae bacterium]|jgi:sulfur carrier protein ThiS|nr:hypothetical protein [Syntrophomonadaceae bacterium]
MEVFLKLYAQLEKYILQPDQNGVTTLSLSENCTVGEMLKSVGIPSGEAGFILLNGNAAQEEQKLKTGDRVEVFPPLEGG